MEVKKKINSILDVGTLICFALYLAYGFLETTMFEIEWPINFSGIVLMAILIISVLRLLLNLSDDSRMKWIISTSISIVLYFCYTQNSYEEIYHLAILSFSLTSIPYKKLLKTYLYVCGTLLLVTICGSLVGCVTDLIYLEGTIVRHSFGVVFTTDFAAHVFYLFVAGFVYFEKVPTWLFSIASFFLSWLIFNLTKSENTTITLFTMGVVVAYISIYEHMKSKGRSNAIWNTVDRCVMWLMKYAYFICAFVIILMTFGYNSNNVFLANINTWISGRLNLGKNAYLTYGLKAFGSQFDMIGAGGNTVSRPGYNFIDSSYCHVLIRYGVIIFILLTSLQIINALNKKKTIRYSAALALVFLTCICEHHLTDICYNIFLVMSFAEFEEQNNNHVLDQDLVTHFLELPKKAQAIIMSIIVIFFLVTWNRFLMIARTIVTVKDLANNNWLYIGISSLSIVAFVEFFKALCWFLNTDKKNRQLLIVNYARIGIALAGIFITALKCNNALDLAEERYGNDVENNITVLNNMNIDLESKGIKIFVDDVPELYVRKGFKVSNKTTTVADAIYDTAIIITNKYNDYRLLYTSGNYSYGEVSECNGIYVNDDSVKERFNQSGICLQRQYTTALYVDLNCLADINGLEKTETGIIVNGADHSLIYGPYKTIMAGNLTVHYKLKLISGSASDGKACTLRTSSNWGTTIFNQMDINYSDFDEDSYLEIVLEQSIPSSEGVEFLVFANADTVIEVEEIKYYKHE